MASGVLGNQRGPELALHFSQGEREAMLFINFSKAGEDGSSNTRLHMPLPPLRILMAVSGFRSHPQMKSLGIIKMTDGNK